MKFTLTSHAKKRCVRRKIQVEWVESALENYVRTSYDPDDSSLIHVYWPVPEKGYKVLKVIYNKSVDPIAIVTAFFENEVITP